MNATTYATHNTPIPPTEENWEYLEALILEYDKDSIFNTCGHLALALMEDEDLIQCLSDYGAHAMHGPPTLAGSQGGP
jgi:hypothetical protein